MFSASSRHVGICQARESRFTTHHQSMVNDQRLATSLKKITSSIKRPTNTLIIKTSISKVPSWNGWSILKIPSLTKYSRQVVVRITTSIVLIRDLYIPSGIQCSPALKRVAVPWSTDCTQLLMIANPMRETTVATISTLAVKRVLASVISSILVWFALFRMNLDLRFHIWLSDSNTLKISRLLKELDMQVVGQ